MKKLGLLFIVLLSACNLSPVNHNAVNPQADFWLRIGGEVDRILTSRVLAPSVVVDPSGQPVVVWQESPTTSYDIYVKRWNNQFSRWDALGAKLDNSSLQNAIEPDIAIDALGNLFVVWTELSSSSYNIYVKRSGGLGSWQKVGDVLDIIPSAKADQPSIAVSGNGSPFIAWRENNKIHTKYWDGVSWISLGQVNASVLPASLPDISLDANDMPIVAWVEKGSDNKSDAYISKWNGTEWRMLGVVHDTAQDATDLSLTVDVNGRTTVALILDSDLVIKRLQAGVWQTLGDKLDNSPANMVTSPSISADPTGKIHVAWSELEGTNYSIYTKSWNGSWQLLGTTLDIDVSKRALSPALATNASGHMFIGWQEYSGTLNQNDIHVREWKTKSWQSLGDTLDVVSQHSIHTISMDIDKKGNPVVAWRESNNSVSNLYVKQWNGKVWVQVGTKVNTTSSIGTPILNINPLGHIYIAYVSGGKLIVKRWQSGIWQAIGDPISSVSSFDLDLSFTVSGQPVVAYDTFNRLFVKRWNGTAWVNWGSQVNKNHDSYFSAFELSISETNQPFMTYVQESSNLLIVNRLNGTDWESIGTFSTPSSDLHSVGFDMSIDNSGHPIIVFQGYESNNYSIYVKRWDGNRWRSLGSALDINIWRNTYFPSLVIDNFGNPNVIWIESIPDEDFNGIGIAFVKRWNGSSWMLVGNGIRKGPNWIVQKPTIGVNSSNNPIVAWTENANLYVSSY